MFFRSKQSVGAPIGSMTAATEAAPPNAGFAMPTIPGIPKLGMIGAIAGILNGAGPTAVDTMLLQ